ncbi:hypothetical protein O7632_14870 [Solwaraspora sp. WMMD406]|uniref:membrane protein YczE n=1 Tax=Solwaraspora sp. WMMD406 TaxID=3016095 RepID=UPI0024169DAD|nr:hypothetical protein [Solwaraspora sp. WMMD406]MDG4765367.1 hypothetical protein [Solwaraspora sp. WMMD406]
MNRIGNVMGRRLGRRIGQLYLGLVLYGVSMAMMIESDLGLNPWDVFHEGLTERVGLSFGVVTMIVGAAVLLLWLPLRQRPGLGTVSNVVVIGLAVDAALAWLSTPPTLAARIALLVGGVVLNGLATGMYIGARMGPGPRDGLMTGWVARHPRTSVRLVRTVIELTVLGSGWLLGGSVGLGTLFYALSIGPLVQVFLPICTVPPDRATSSDAGYDSAPITGRDGAPAPVSAPAAGS